jgi:hypothetical protein
MLAEPGGEELLPAYWSDNYLSLLPGETRRLTVDLPAPPAGASLQLACDGWNINPARAVGRRHTLSAGIGL